MRSTILKAVIEEVRTELDKRLPATDVPSTRRIRGGMLELGYVESAYRVNIEVDREAEVMGSLTRLPCYRLTQCGCKLWDPDLFSEIGREFATSVSKDRLLVRALGKFGERLLASLRQAVVVPAGWRTTYYGPAVEGNQVHVNVAFAPSDTQVALPDISFRLVLAGYRSGKFKVSVATDETRLDSVRSWVIWQIDTPESIQGKQFTLASLPKAVVLSIQHIESFVASRIERLLPIQSVHASPLARQAMLVLVPLRIADAARQTDDVDWCRNLTAACLDRLVADEPSHTNLIRKLFFQLIKVELAAKHEREEARHTYEQLGLELAAQRKGSDSLPFNPALAYTLHDRTRLESKLTDEDRRLYDWFNEHATLEQLIDLMGLL